jgi:hypothetical protein
MATNMIDGENGSCQVYARLNKATEELDTEGGRRFKLPRKDNSISAGFILGGMALRMFVREQLSTRKQFTRNAPSLPLSSAAVHSV